MMPPSGRPCPRERHSPSNCARPSVTPAATSLVRPWLPCLAPGLHFSMALVRSNVAAPCARCGSSTSRLRGSTGPHEPRFSR
eukprot:12955798-Heterocapsa_arctica.AAC.1